MFLISWKRILNAITRLWRPSMTLPSQYHSLWQMLHWLSKAFVSEHHLSYFLYHLTACERSYFPIHWVFGSKRLCFKRCEIKTSTEKKNYFISYFTLKKYIVVYGNFALLFGWALVKGYVIVRKEFGKGVFVRVWVCMKYAKNTWRIRCIFFCFFGRVQ